MLALINGKLTMVPNPSVPTPIAQPSVVPAAALPPSQPHVFDQGGTVGQGKYRVFNYTPNQAALIDPDKWSLCGPVAAMAFARSHGRAPTIAEAKALAIQVGWKPDAGMAGPQSEVNLLNKMGVPSTLADASEQRLQRDLASGNPVIISTPQHYFVAEHYDPKTGRYDVGTSGTILASTGGKEWMTLDEIKATGRGIQGAIYMNSPVTPNPSPTVQTAQPGGNGGRPQTPLRPLGGTGDGVDDDSPPTDGGGDSGGGATSGGGGGVTTVTVGGQTYNLDPDTGAIIIAAPAPATAPNPTKAGGGTISLPPGWKTQTGGDGNTYWINGAGNWYNPKTGMMSDTNGANWKPTSPPQPASPVGTAITFPPAPTGSGGNPAAGTGPQTVQDAQGRWFLVHPGKPVLVLDAQGVQVFDANGDPVTKPGVPTFTPLARTASDSKPGSAGNPTQQQLDDEHAIKQAQTALDLANARNVGSNVQTPEQRAATIRLQDAQAAAALHSAGAPYGLTAGQTIGENAADRASREGIAGANNASAEKIAAERIAQDQRNLQATIEHNKATEQQAWWDLQGRVADLNERGMHDAANLALQQGIAQINALHDSNTDKVAAYDASLKAQGQAYDQWQKDQAHTESLAAHPVSWLEYAAHQGAGGPTGMPVPDLLQQANLNRPPSTLDFVGHDPLQANTAPLPEGVTKPYVYTPYVAGQGGAMPTAAGQPAPLPAAPSTATAPSADAATAPATKPSPVTQPATVAPSADAKGNATVQPRSVEPSRATPITPTFIAPASSSLPAVDSAGRPEPVVPSGPAAAPDNDPATKSQIPFPAFPSASRNLPPGMSAGAPPQPDHIPYAPLPSSGPAPHLTGGLLLLAQGKQAMGLPLYDDGGTVGAGMGARDRWYNDSVPGDTDTGDNVDFTPYIEKRAAAIGIPAHVATALYDQESGRQHYSAPGQVKIGETGDIGIGQINPGQHPDAIESGDAFHPYRNIDYTMNYLQRMKDYYDGDLRKALTAYNWGPGNLDRVRGDTTKAPPRTQKYVNDILSAWAPVEKTPPTNPPEGQKWKNPSNNTDYTFRNGAWATYDQGGTIPLYDGGGTVDEPIPTPTQPPYDPPRWNPGYGDGVWSPPGYVAPSPEPMPHGGMPSGPIPAGMGDTVLYDDGGIIQSNVFNPDAGQRYRSPVRPRSPYGLADDPYPQWEKPRPSPVTGGFGNALGSSGTPVGGLMNPGMQAPHHGADQWPVAPAPYKLPAEVGSLANSVAQQQHAPLQPWEQLANTVAGQQQQRHAAPLQPWEQLANGVIGAQGNAPQQPQRQMSPGQHTTLAPSSAGQIQNNVYGPARPMPLFDQGGIVAGEPGSHQFAMLPPGTRILPTQEVYAPRQPQMFDHGGVVQQWGYENTPGAQVSTSPPSGGYGPMGVYDQGGMIYDHGGAVPAIVQAGETIIPPPHTYDTGGTVAGSPVGGMMNPGMQQRPFRPSPVLRPLMTAGDVRALPYTPPQIRQALTPLGQQGSWDGSGLSPYRTVQHGFRIPSPQTVNALPTGASEALTGTIGSFGSWPSDYPWLSKV